MVKAIISNEYKLGMGGGQNTVTPILVAVSYAFIWTDSKIYAIVVGNIIIKYYY